MTKNQAINKYIKDNCILLQAPKCSCCNGTSGNIYEDEFAGKNYCYTCLIKDLESDEEALKDYFSGAEDVG